MVNLKHLRAFDAVVRELNFTRAAESVHLTQPALSALIKQLETDLGVQLLYRRTRKVEVTEIGKEFHQVTKKLLTEFDEAITDVQTFRAIKRGVIRIGALPSLCTSFLPPILKRFSDRYPDVKIKVIDAPGQEITEALTSRNIDIGLSYFQDEATIDAEHLFHDELIVVCSSESEASTKSSITWKKLTQFPVIAVAQGTTTRALIDATVLSKGLTIDIALEPRLMPTALAYAAANLGVAILPSSGVSAQLPEQLCVVRLKDPAVKRQLSILTLKHSALSPAATALRTEIRNSVKP